VNEKLLSPFTGTKLVTYADVYDDEQTGKSLTELVGFFKLSPAVPELIKHCVEENLYQINGFFSAPPEYKTGKLLSVRKIAPPCAALAMIAPLVAKLNSIAAEL
jgi:hypothetical protein